VRSRELPPDDAHDAPGGKPEDQDKGPGQEYVQRQEQPAEFHAQSVLEDQKAESPGGALAHRIAQDDARMPGDQLFVNLEPNADRKPAGQRKSQDQGLLLRGQVEQVIQKMPVQGNPRDIGYLEGHRGQDDFR